MRDLTQLAREDALGLLILALMVSRLAVTLLAADRIIPPESKVELVARAKPVETTPFTEGRLFTGADSSTLRTLVTAGSYA